MKIELFVCSLLNLASVGQTCSCGKLAHIQMCRMYFEMSFPCICMEFCRSSCYPGFGTISAFGLCPLFQPTDLGDALRDRNHAHYLHLLKVNKQNKSLPSEFCPLSPVCRMQQV